MNLTFPGRRRVAVLLAVLIVLIVLVVLGLGAAQGWRPLRPQGPGPAFVSGNGRIEATEIDIATQQPGRIAQILVEEGDLVRAGQLVARMDLPALQAGRDEALARVQQAREKLGA